MRKIKPILILTMLFITSCTSNQILVSNRNILDNNKTHSVNDLITNINCFSSNQYSDKDYTIKGTVIGDITPLNEYGYQSFNICDGSNLEKTITIFLANSKEMVYEKDIVTIKGKVHRLGTNQIEITGFKENETDYQPCEVIDIVRPNLNRTTKNVSNDDLTMLEVVNYLSVKNAHYPMTDEFVERYQQTSGGYLDNARKAGKIVDRQQHEPDQKWHFFESWFYPSIEEGSITYEESAKSRVYNKLLCPELCLWFYEAFEVNPVSLSAALKVAEKGKRNGISTSSIASQMRKEISWEEIVNNVRNIEPVVIEATDVTLNQHQVNMSTNDRYSLSFDVVPLNATQKPVWTIEEGNDVVTINSNNQTCEIIPLKEGEAKVSVRFNEKVYDECLITIKDIVSIVGIPNTLDLEIDDQFVMNPRLSKGEGYFTYSTKGTDVISLIDNKIIAIGNGSAEIVISNIENKDILKIIKVEVFDHGKVLSPLSIDQAFSLANMICVSEGDSFNKDIYVQGKAKDNATKNGSFTLLGNNNELPLNGSILDDKVSEVAQNDNILIKGKIHKINNKIAFSNDTLILKNERGQSNIRVGICANATIKVGGFPFVNQTLTNGESFVFTVDCEPNYIIDKVKINDNPINGVDGVYSFIVNGNSFIDVITKDTRITYGLISRYSISTEISSLDGSTALSSLICEEGDTSLINSISDVTKVAGRGNGGKNDTAWNTTNVWKFGTTSTNGYLTLNLNKEVNYITILGYVHGDKCEIQVGDSSSTDWTSETKDNKTTNTSLSTMAIISKNVLENGEPTTITITFDSTNQLKISNIGKVPLYIISFELGLMDIEE